MALNRKQLYRFLAESIGEKVLADNDDIISQADQVISGEYVDLGLPSGRLWAKCNLGANEEWEYGDYYGWGMTEPYDYEVGESTDDYNLRILRDLKGENDAVSVQKGSAWHMPSKGDYEELFKNTYARFLENYHGVSGYFFYKVKDASHKGQKDKVALSHFYQAEKDEHVFFPFAGYFLDSEPSLAQEHAYYWTSSIENRKRSAAFALRAYSFGIVEDNPYYGFSIRGILR